MEGGGANSTLLTTGRGSGTTSYGREGKNTLSPEMHNDSDSSPLDWRAGFTAVGHFKPQRLFLVTFLHGKRRGWREKNVREREKRGKKNYVKCMPCRTHGYVFAILDYTCQKNHLLHLLLLSLLGPLHHLILHCIKVASIIDNKVPLVVLLPLQ